MRTELHARGAADRTQQAPHAKPGAIGVGRRGRRLGFQAGIPQERVNEKSTTMKRMIAGTPNAT
jgi:hypothetical protein